MTPRWLVQLNGRWAGGCSTRPRRLLSACTGGCNPKCILALSVHVIGMGKTILSLAFIFVVG